MFLLIGRTEGPECQNFSVSFHQPVGTPSLTLLLSFLAGLSALSWYEGLVSGKHLGRRRAICGEVVHFGGYAGRIMG